MRQLCGPHCAACGVVKNRVSAPHTSDMAAAVMATGITGIPRQRSVLSFAAESPKGWGPEPRASFVSSSGRAALDRLTHSRVLKKRDRR